MIIDAFVLSKFVYVSKGDCYRPRPNGFYELEENCVGKTAWGGTRYDIFTDEYGFRVGSQTKRDAPRLRSLLFLGDSFVFGINGGWQDTFVGMVESALPMDNVFNGGVTSYSPTPYLYTLTKTYKRHIKPNVIISAVDISDVQDEAAKCLLLKEMQDPGLKENYEFKFEND